MHRPIPIKPLESQQLLFTVLLTANMVNSFNKPAQYRGFGAACFLKRKLQDCGSVISFSTGNLPVHSHYTFKRYKNIYIAGSKN